MGVTKNSYVDFTKAPASSWFAKATNAVPTAVNAQQDLTRIEDAFGCNYFELAQGVGALGANTLLTTAGFTPASNGWLVCCDNAATDSIEITQGIVSGPALSFVTGTDPAFYMRGAIIVGHKAYTTNTTFGFRKLVAYETASTEAESLAAYDDKAFIGLLANAGAYKTQTSKAATDLSTTLARTALTDGNLLLAEIKVDGAGVVTYRLAETTPAGTTNAQIQTALAAARTALAADANAVAFTFTAGIEVVPSFIFASAGAGATDTRLVAWEVGYQ